MEQREDSNTTICKMYLPDDEDGPFFENKPVEKSYNIIQGNKIYDPRVHSEENKR